MTMDADFLPIQHYLDPLRRLMRMGQRNWAFRLRFLHLTLMGACLLALSPVGFAQAPQRGGAASAPSAIKSLPAGPLRSASSGTAWSELTPVQQQTLKPLADSWNTISQAQKRKWLEISKNYASLPPEGQATMRSRMNEWVALSPQQRAQARLNFAKTKELSRALTPEEKNEKWQAYQALSAEEKQKLAAKASPKPAGAATAVKPVAPQKLAAVPPRAEKPASRPATKIQHPAVAASQPAAPPAGESGAEIKR